jgi:hypothetical protein
MEDALPMSPRDRLAAPLARLLGAAQRVEELALAELNCGCFAEELRDLRLDLPHLCRQAVAALRGDEALAADLRHDLRRLRADVVELADWAGRAEANLREALNSASADAALRYGQAWDEAFREYERRRQRVQGLRNRAFLTADRVCAAAERSAKGAAAGASPPPNPQPPASSEPEGQPTKTHEQDGRRVNLQHRAIGQEKPGAWHVFYKIKGEWCHQGKFENFSAGRQEAILEGFAAGGGFLGQGEALKRERKTHSQGDAAELKQRIHPEISKIGKQIRFALGTKDKAVKPFVWDRQMKGWQAMVQIGYAVREDGQRVGEEGRLRFRMRHQLSADECADRR